MSGREPASLNHPTLQAAHVGNPKCPPIRLTLGYTNDAAIQMTLLTWDALQ